MKKRIVFLLGAVLFTAYAVKAQNIAPENTNQSKGQPVSAAQENAYQMPAPSKGNKAATLNGKTVFKGMTSGGKQKHNPPSRNSGNSNPKTVSKGVKIMLNPQPLPPGITAGSGNVPKPK